MKDWSSKRVIIIGAARQGIALAKFLSRHGASVVITDVQSADVLYEAQQSLSDFKVEWILGQHPIRLLDECDLVCPSGGVPLSIPFLLEAQTRGIPLSNDSQIFLENAPCTVIGITGSAGKTTTTTLVGRIIGQGIGFERTWIGGNIGDPLISYVDDMESDHVAIMELSSFQLEIMTISPKVAVVLNVTPNHLDRHVTMEAYSQTKANILNYQQLSDFAVLGGDNPGSWEMRKSVKGELIAFGTQKPNGDHPGIYLQNSMISFWDGFSYSEILSRDEISLRGEHNLNNVLAACAISYAVNVPFELMRTGIKGFSGVAHRLERVRHWGGAEWFNDSIATAPERSMAAIRSFDQPLVLLAGGRDKELPWNEFSNLVRQRVDHLILFGQAKRKIQQALGSVDPGLRPYTIHSCLGLKEAVETAKEIVSPGDIVLLSPGGTSFDEFRDFAERGDWYREWVNKLP